MPLAVFLSTLELAFWKVTPEVSYSVAYASSTAKSLLLFLLGITIFYTGEAMHRDRELRIEPLLWTIAVPNHVLLLSKFLATVLLALILVVLVGLTALILQIIKQDTPIDISAYVKVYLVILVPGIVFLAAATLALNVLLRDKYVVYALSIATCVGLFFLYGQGHNHWLYNPLLYQLWNYTDLTGENTQPRIFAYRIYCLAIAFLCLALAHLGFPRGRQKE